jgi:hypothetical protein
MTGLSSCHNLLPGRYFHRPARNTDDDRGVAPGGRSEKTHAGPIPETSAARIGSRQGSCVRHTTTLQSRPSSPRFSSTTDSALR